MFKENLRYLRHLNHESQHSLAEMLGYKSFTTIQKWEDGTSLPSLAKIKIIAEHYNVPFEMMCNDKIEELVVNKTKVPVVGSVKAGYGLLADENISAYELVYNSEAENGTYFYLDVVGDSMKNIRICEGDRVYCKKQNTVENGEIAVVLLDDGEATLKRVLFKDKKMILKPENDAMQCKEYTDEEISEKGILILGKLIHNKILY